MAEQQDEALQQRDLNQHECATQACEVEDRSERPRSERAARREGERTENEEDDQERRDRQEHEQGRQAAGGPRAGILRTLDVHPQHPEPWRHERVVAQLRGVEEERAVVGRRRDVERVLCGERPAIRCAHQAGVVVAVVAE
jgi:hypothetical protein